MSVIDTEEGRKLLTMVEIGIDAEVFLAGKLGGEIFNRIMQDREDALNRLEDVDPYDAKAVQAAQNNAKLPIMFLQYLNDCIQEGNQAERVLNELEQ